jgi:hypothetical protein
MKTNTTKRSISFVTFLGLLTSLIREENSDDD